MTARSDGFAELFQQDMDRRLAGLIRYGTVIETKYDDKAGPRVKVEAGGFKTGWIPWSNTRSGEDKDWHPLDKGEQVVLVSPSGDMAQAAIIGTINQSKFASFSSDPDVSGREWKDKARDTYDRKKHERRIKLPDEGTIVLEIGETKIEITKDKVLVKASSRVVLDTPVTEVTGELQVAGLITYGGGMIGSGDTGTGNVIEMTGNIRHRDGSFDSNGVIIHTHTHPGVQSGGAETAPPSRTGSTEEPA